MVTFIWEARNTAHLASHGVTPEVAEMVFWAGRDTIKATSTSWRFVTESEVEGRAYRLFFDMAADGETVYPVTCYPI